MDKVDQLLELLEKMAADIREIKEMLAAEKAASIGNRVQAMVQQDRANSLLSLGSSDASAY